MSPVLLVVAALMVLRLAGELVLSALNRAEVRRHATDAPPAVAAIMDPATYAKSVAYTLEKSSFGIITGGFDALLLALVIFGGVLPWIYGRVTAWGGPGAVWSQVVFILITGMLLASLAGSRS